MASAETIRVSFATSANTGVAPARTIRLTVETQVMEGVITSSPGPMPRARRRRCIPAVPEDSATAPRHPTYSQNLCSNSAPLGPVVIQPERRTSATAAISPSVMDGLENGRNSFLNSHCPLTARQRANNTVLPLETKEEISRSSSTNRMRMDNDFLKFLTVIEMIIHIASGRDVTQDKNGPT
jgi:hypothetical protein